MCETFVFAAERFLFSFSQTSVGRDCDHCIFNWFLQVILGHLFHVSQNSCRDLLRAEQLLLLVELHPKLQCIAMVTNFKGIFSLVRIACRKARSPMFCARLLTLDYPSYIFSVSFVFLNSLLFCVISTVQWSGATSICDGIIIFEHQREQQREHQRGRQRNHHREHYREYEREHKRDHSENTSEHTKENIRDNIGENTRYSLDFQPSS